MTWLSYFSRVCLIFAIYSKLVSCAVREYLSFSDLEALGSSPDALRNEFRDLFGETPDGLAMNHESYFRHFYPAITEEFGVWCYKYLGDVRSYYFHTPTERSVILGSQTVSNNSSFSLTSSFEIDESWTETTSHTTSSNIGLSFSQEISVTGIFSTGLDFSIETSTSETKTQTRQGHYSSTQSVTLPPHSEITLDVVGIMKRQTVDFSAPITVDGRVGAHFKKKVSSGWMISMFGYPSSKHYDWFVPIVVVVPKTSGTMYGSITGSKAFNVTVKARDPVFFYKQK